MTEPSAERVASLADRGGFTASDQGCGMPVFEYESRIRAPLETVWKFHSTADGLVKLTPDWVQLSVDEVRGPDGEPDPEILEAGSEITLSVRPFGVGLRRSETSRITERVVDDGSAYFVDEMVDGPFETWRHRHSFHADGEETVCADHVEYTPPLGRLGALARPGLAFGLNRLFRYRHRRMRTLLESAGTSGDP
jgi:ligand-binding SRPBCC domain-containing protein